MARVLIISDTQFPFHHPDAFLFLQALKKKYRPDEVVHAGDEVDFHALGDWDHDPDGYSAGQELEHAIEAMYGLYAIFPEVKACISNHTIRPLKKAFKAGIPRKFMRDYHEFLEAPAGWKWKDYWEIDGVRYEHGEGVSGQNGHIKAAKENRQSTVIGHIHAFAGVNWSGSPNDLIFGMNVGCLIDKNAYAFKYGKHFRNKPILGSGVVLDGVPQFVPMILNKHGRWNKKL